MVKVLPKNAEKPMKNDLFFLSPMLHASRHGVTKCFAKQGNFLSVKAIFLRGVQGLRVLADGDLFCRIVFVHCSSVLVRLLGSSFAKLGFSVGLCGFANVSPKALT
ncbi:MAG: hypothetical protein NZM35_12320, partial [Chitinophagales bacterium]|nr:hypothetical protein [Chitinophagales bacterium]